MPQTINLHSVCYNMWGRKTQYRHKGESGGVVEEVMREREVTSLNPTGREAREFYANPTGCEAREFYAKNTGWALAGGCLTWFNNFFLLFFFGFFFGFDFTKCFSLPSVFGTRQRLCRVPDK